MPRILLVEDDPRLSRSIADQLRGEGMECVQVYDGDLAVRAMDGQRFDLVLLDLSLPGRDGFSVCEHIRRSDRNIPVIILTAFSDIDDKMNAFSIGADDYLVKPVHFKELLAKVNVFLKRAEANPLMVEHLRVGDLSMDLARKRVERDGRTIELSPKEFALLAHLARHPGRVFSKDELAEQVWDGSLGVSSNTIEVYISFLRSKVDKGSTSKLIHTRHGFGYYMDTAPR
ncbi:MAG: response regulator transcription factor [Flavobacteriales bacterium]